MRYILALALFYTCLSGVSAAAAKFTTPSSRALCTTADHRCNAAFLAISDRFSPCNLAARARPLRMTPAMALGITDRVWSIAELIEAALKAVPTKPTPTPAQRRKSFRVIQGDLFE
jgi:hypothetical protein